MTIPEEEKKRADAAFDAALDRYEQETQVYRNACVTYMLDVGVEEAQPKMDEALNRIGHIESRVVESVKEGMSS